MKYDSILERLDEQIVSLVNDKVSMYAVFNRLKDTYIDIIKNGYMSNDSYLELAAYVIYAGLLMEE
jgi:transposase